MFDVAFGVKVHKDTGFSVGALRGLPAEGVAEKKGGKAAFLWSEGETSPLISF
jgi:hypothetical protein